MEERRDRDSTGMSMHASSGEHDSPVDTQLRAERPVSSWWVVLGASAGLLICTGGPSYYVAQHLTHPAGGWQSWMYIYPFAVVAVAGALGVGRRLAWLPIRRWPWPFFAVGAYVALALLSVLWSVSPSITPTAAVIGIGIASFGCWFGWCLRIDDQIWAVVISTAAASIGSLLVVLVRPAFGKMYQDLGVAVVDPPWQGIFGNRNSLAPVCVLGLVGLVGFIVRRPSLRRLVLAAPLAAIHIVLLRQSEGLTSRLALILVAFTAVATPALRWVRRLRVPGAVVTGAVAAALVVAWFALFANLDRLSSKFGRDRTLDGRTPIWADVRSFIRVHPLRGYGFWAFWDRQDLTAASYARLGPYGSAHNSVLEVLLMLGLVGLIFYLVICGAAILGPLVWSWRRQSVAAWWWSLVVVFLVAENLTESFVLWHSYIWVLFLAAAFAPFGIATQSDAEVKRDVSVQASSPDEDGTDATEPAARAELDDVWENSATSIAELLSVGDIDEAMTGPGVQALTSKDPR
jgi:exopolysaccharide production protein ExoQ